ncbi:hypothetical protein KDAU_65200 [Dictyobacter aurantiacus]|uniref:Helicase HerA central domain-containing protein n=2 Tax=Dictyobacter aurantiacus TaxID=1936993 RepID=A0A401ZQQ1_9CHLR|nr:hypothetical protein KDAU_65200 [Dictyobacter aurantiacus]
MQEETQVQPQHDNPLVKEVAGHLFTFEEKIFGMSLTQLLTDLGVLTGTFSLTGALPLVPHLISCVLITLVAMVFVHARIQGVALVTWLYLIARSKTIPTKTTWQAHKSNQSRQAPGSKPLPSVQATWIPIDTLHHGIGCKIYQHKKGATIRSWTALEIEGKNIGLLPEHEQLRIFRRFEGFLGGLDFHLQVLSITEQVDAQQAPGVVAQQTALATLSQTPRLRAFQQESIRIQQQHMASCTRTRHVLIVSAASTDAVFQHPNGSPSSVRASAIRLLRFHQRPPVSQAQVLDQLHIRISVVRKAMQHLGMHIWPLQNQEALQLFACCLAPGSAHPTFAPELLASQRGSKNYKKRILGLHGAFVYSSPHARCADEPGILDVADLLAPSAVTIEPDVLQIQAGTQTRYMCTFTITGYGHHLLCGWMQTLHDLGLPLVVSSQMTPIDSRFMILKLEQALTRLESQRLSNQKTLRITRADQTVEANQIRRITHALAARTLKIFDVSITICVHASTMERLEQRCRYLLSHLRDMQLQARPASYQHDLAWQSCLPVGLDRLQHGVKLTSDVVSTMLPGTGGTIGTPTGVFLGYTGSGFSRRPVYLNPWSQDKKIANPHVVVIGETGQGKSWLGKTIATGFMGLGLADVVVLDKDDDYLPLHEALAGESQRYSLARSCPINLFDIPFGPADVDPDDPADILAEFFDNALLTGLALLVTDEESKLSKGEEAYLTTVARATYAACGITSEAIRHDPDTLLKPPPTLADFIKTMQSTPTSSESMRQSLLERLEKASYLFQTGQTSVSLEKPLTIFSIKGLDSKWFALMTYVVQNFLQRHRALKKDDRYLAYIVEEASYLLKHAAGQHYLENWSRSFRKLGIALITLSQHPRDFLEAGQVILSNAGTVFYLGMQRTAVEKLNLPAELERILVEGIPGQCVVRIGNEYAPLSIWSNPVYRALFTTDPVERRAMRMKTQRPGTLPQAPGPSAYAGRASLAMPQQKGQHT